MARSLACTLVPGPVIVIPTPIFKSTHSWRMHDGLSYVTTLGPPSHCLVDITSVTCNMDISNSPLKHVPS